MAVARPAGAAQPAAADLLRAVSRGSAAGLMAQLSPFPSRRYLLVLVATIATALLLVGLAARLIRNPLLRRIVTWGLWIYVTLYYLGLTRPATGVPRRRGDRAGRLPAVGLCGAEGAGGHRAPVRAGASGLGRRPPTASAPTHDISPSMKVLAVKMLQVGALRRRVLHRAEGGGLRPDRAGGAVRRDRRRAGLRPAEGGVEPGLGGHHPARQVDQAGRRDLDRRHLRLDQHAGRPLCLDHHPRRQANT